MIIPDPGALCPAPCRGEQEGGVGGSLAKRSCRSRDLSKHPLLVCPQALEKHVKARPNGKEWKVGKQCTLKGGLHSQLFSLTGRSI